VGKLEAISSYVIKNPTRCNSMQ